MPRRRQALALLALALPLALAGCIAPPPDSERFDLSSPLHNPHMPLMAETVRDLRDTTGVTCADLGCVEAWDSAHALYLRFETMQAAADYAAAAEDVTIDRYVVIDYSGREAPTTVRFDIETTVLIQLPPRHAPFSFGQP